MKGGEEGGAQQANKRGYEPAWELGHLWVWEVCATLYPSISSRIPRLPPQSCCGLSLNNEWVLST